MKRWRIRYAHYPLSQNRVQIAVVEAENQEDAINLLAYELGDAPVFPEGHKWPLGGPSAGYVGGRTYGYYSCEEHIRPASTGRVIERGA